MTANPVTRIEPIDDSLALITATQKTALEAQFERAALYPRDEADAMKRAITVATQSEEVAEACMYSLPERKGSDKRIEGPSVRLAEIIVSQWGNLMVEARVLVVDEKHITAEGRGVDFQSNNAVSVQVRRRITNRSGQRYSDDMITVTGNAACAIAFRNVVYKLVPSALVQPAYEAVKKAAVGDESKLEVRRDNVIKRLQDTFHISLARILHACGVEDVKDITADHLEGLIGYGTALKNGDSTVDEVFPPPGREQAESVQDKIKDLPEADLPDPVSEPAQTVKPGDEVSTPMGPGVVAQPTPTPSAAPQPAPEATEPAKDEPAPPADEAGTPQEAPATDAPAPPAGGSLNDEVRDVLAQAADLLSERSGQERDVCRDKLVSYITKKKYPRIDIMDLTVDQAKAVLIDVKIVQDVSTLC